MTALRSQLADTYAPATGNRILTAVRGVLKECLRLGCMPIVQHVSVRDIPPLRGRRLPKGRMLPEQELALLFQVCAQDDRPAGPRDAAMLALLYGAGLRRSEFVSLDIDDYDHRSPHRTSGQGE
jgi:site-specific recombinase XerD